MYKCIHSETTPLCFSSGFHIKQRHKQTPHRCCAVGREVAEVGTSSNKVVAETEPLPLHYNSTASVAGVRRSYFLNTRSLIGSCKKINKRRRRLRLKIAASTSGP